MKVDQVFVAAFLVLLVIILIPTSAVGLPQPAPLTTTISGPLYYIFIPAGAGTNTGVNFLPASVTVAAGTAIVFVNNDTGIHDIWFETAPSGGNFPSNPSPNSNTWVGNEFNVTFTVPGTYTVGDLYHTWLYEKITVLPSFSGSITFTSPSPGAFFSGIQDYTISGQISSAPPLPDNVSIVVQPFGSSQVIDDARNVTVTASGNFSYVMVAGLGNSSWPSGPYLITVTGANHISSSTTFEYTSVCQSICISFASASATWGPSGAAEGVFVLVTNGWVQSEQLTIYATMKSGTSIYVLVGGEAIPAGQNGTVFLQDFLIAVPVGTYTVTFSAITIANQAASAPTTPVTLTT
ncbi:MAG: hypothetical protein OK456_06540 [Thaumarchaeota archaeon]|nr:hypothetical protein [Nitrososphaerota archaeon]